MSADDPLWYKDAIVYELHVKAFFDADNNGVGDFRGLTQKLDYLQDLGVTALWLLPFYPSPLRDDGYDIADYTRINPSYGSMRDFRQFVREAHRRGLRVINELVINHTSDQHPWFQRARRARPGSVWRDYYVWSDTDQRYQDTRIIFTDTETSNWAWDPEAQAYYWHRFFSHQPDLNFGNPRVFKAITGAMRFWLAAGVDGMRLDAIPYLCEREGTNNENLPETHDVVKRLRAWLDGNFPGRMMLAEANQWPEDVRPYFGDGDECHMAFHFPVMPRIYMALAQEDRHPVTDILRQTPDIPETCQWAVFLRNHDELTLEMVTDRERDYLWSFYAADPRARVNVGIRRRLASLLDNDRNKIQLLNSLLMSLPGTPFLYYGDEIGMGDNVFLGDRDGVRTPMQWSPDRNGGFSRADPPQLYLPPVMDPVYGFEAVNVEAQARSPSSLLNWMKRLIAVRKAYKAFGRGNLSLLYPGNRKVFAFLRQYADETILCVANLSRSAQPVELDLSAFSGRVPIELLGRSAFPTIGELPYFVTLPGYGFYWFLLAQEAESPAWHEDVKPVVPELMTLVLPQGWASLLAGGPRASLEGRVLPEYLLHQRWFGGKGRKISVVEIAGHVEAATDKGVWLLCTLDVKFRSGSAQRYFLPLAIAWESTTEDPQAVLAPYVLCRVRRGARVGVLYDGLADPALVRFLMHAMGEQDEGLASEAGRLLFSRTGRFPAGIDAENLDVQRLGREQSNTSLLVGGDMILKVYRRIEAGIHPEVEIGRYLTDVAGFENTPPLLGAVEAEMPGGERTALAILQRFVRNQGDGWGYTLDHLARYLEDAALVSPEQGEPVDSEARALYLGLVRRLGERTAEMHRAFALKTGDPAFDPQPVTRRDMRRWAQDAQRQAKRAFRQLQAVRRKLPRPLRGDVDRLLRREKRILGMIEALLPKPEKLAGLVATRHHGDFHLGQVVVVRDDIHILDFEGEPARGLEERRAKHLALRDVAGMLRSFNYAAWSALFSQSAERPGALPGLQSFVEAWEREVAETFEAGYQAAIGDCAGFPANAAIRRKLITFFLMEKVFYEICYEAANRPEWLRIPLSGLMRLLENRR